MDCRSKILRGILSMHELLEAPGAEWMDGFIAERLRRGIQLQVIRSPSRESEHIWPSSQDELRELRYAPTSMDLGMTMYLYDERVLYVSSRKENFALVIESPELSALNGAMFDGLWITLGSSPARRTR
ncbi:TrmB family transcriptional regulator [Afipia sp. P52-10]|nr:TrmB family transcriptional regulator [Afipia sp. P52-10]